MSYASSPSPPENTPAVLGDSGWRLRHSAWLLAPILGLGIFGCIGFVYIAARTRSRQLWIIAAAYCGVSVLLGVSLSVGPSSGPWSSVNGFLLLALWLGGTIHAVILNRQYLRWRATSRPWYAYGRVAPLAGAAPASFAPQQSAQPVPHLEMNTDQYFAPAAAAVPAPAPAASRPSPPTGPLHTPQSPRPTERTDVNRADATALAQVPGLDSQWAQHIISVRASRVGFTGFTDFIDAVGMQPHHAMRVRDHVAFTPVSTTDAAPPQRSTRGRIVDF